MNAAFVFAAPYLSRAYHGGAGANSHSEQRESIARHCPNLQRRKHLRSGLHSQPDEAEDLFDSVTARIAAPTAYARAKGAHFNTETRAGWW